MRPTKSLARLEHATIHRLQFLRGCALEAARTYQKKSSRIDLAFATIEAVNTWNEFSRAFYLSCTLQTVTTKGQRVQAPGFLGTTLNDAIGQVMAIEKPYAKPQANGQWKRRDEPAWHDTKLLIRACSEIQCTNLPQVAASLSTGTRAFLDLPAIRNFFAHRNHSTFRTAQDIATNYGISKLRPPHLILSTRPIKRPYPLLVEWIDDMSAVAMLICE